MRYQPHVVFPQPQVAFPQHQQTHHMQCWLHVAFPGLRVTLPQSAHMRYLLHVAFPGLRVTLPQQLQCPPQVNMAN